MIREVYRALNFLLFVMVALFACALQSVLLRIPILTWLGLDFLLLLVVYIGIYRPLLEGAALVLVIARLAEVHSGSPVGLLSFCYMFVCLTIYFTKEMFLFGTPFSAMLLGMIGGVLFKLCYFILCFYLGVLENVWIYSLEFSVPYLLGLAVFSRPLFALGAKLDVLTNYREISEAKRLAGEDF